MVLEPQWSGGGSADTILDFESLSERDVSVDPRNRRLVIDRTAHRVAILGTPLHAAR